MISGARLRPRLRLNDTRLHLRGEVQAGMVPDLEKRNGSEIHRQGNAQGMGYKQLLGTSCSHCAVVNSNETTTSDTGLHVYFCRKEGHF